MIYTGDSGALSLIMPAFLRFKLGFLSAALYMTRSSVESCVKSSNKAACYFPCCTWRDHLLFDWSYAIFFGSNFLQKTQHELPDKRKTIACVPKKLAIYGIYRKILSIYFNTPSKNWLRLSISLLKRLIYQTFPVHFVLKLK